MATIRVIIAVGLAFLLGACKETLHRGLTEREANEIFSILDTNGISAKREFKLADGTYDILVEKDQISSGVNLLTERGLPRQNFMTMGEVFAGEGFVSTPFEERARYVFGLNQELSHSLSFIEGVSQARVHIVMPEVNRITQNVEDARASVFIYYNPEFDLKGATPQIKTAIATSVDGLTYENVSIAAFMQSNSNQAVALR